MFSSINSTSQKPAVQFDEIAIANFDDFQLVVSTTAQRGKKEASSDSRQALNVIAPVRRYSAYAWLICDCHVAAHCQGLTLGELSAPSPFKPIQRIAPSLPLSFEVLSAFPLTAQALARATFSCQLPSADALYLTVFSQVIPRFVKVYPFEGSDAILGRIEQFLAEEVQFISQNRDRLKYVPFYQQSFKL